MPRPVQAAEDMDKQAWMFTHHIDWSANVEDL
jgi:hypothetical protein